MSQPNILLASDLVNLEHARLSSSHLSVCQRLLSGCAALVLSICGSLKPDNLRSRMAGQKLLAAILVFLSMMFITSGISNISWEYGLLRSVNEATEPLRAWTPFQNVGDTRSSSHTFDVCWIDYSFAITSLTDHSDALEAESTPNGLHHVGRELQRSNEGAGRKLLDISVQGTSSFSLSVSSTFQAPHLSVILYVSELKLQVKDLYYK